MRTVLVSRPIGKSFPQRHVEQSADVIVSQGATVSIGPISILADVADQPAEHLGY